MASLMEWKVPPAFQPHDGDYNFDLERALASVVGLHSIIPQDAFTAETLGTERAGDGRVMEGHSLGFDSVTGFGLVQALGYMNIAPMPLGTSATTRIGDRVVVG